MAGRKKLLIAALLACIPAALTLELESMPVLSSNVFAGAIEQYGVTLLFPGMLGAMAISGNAHAFHLWVAAIWNFVFYFLICWAIAALIGRALYRISSSQRASKL
jgi:ABC-type uncharacterized transport system fused permease/ATPase subunit